MIVSIFGLGALALTIYFLSKNKRNGTMILGIITIVLFVTAQKIDPPGQIETIFSIMTTIGLWITVIILIKSPIESRVDSAKTEIVSSMNSMEKVMSTKFDNVIEHLKGMEDSLKKR